MDLALAEEEGRENRLREALEPLRSRYSTILLDCPPSLSLLPVNALLAADRFLVPVTPQYLALEGLVNLMEAVDKVQQGFGGGASLLGFLLTMVDYRARVTSEIVKILRLPDVKEKLGTSLGMEIVGSTPEELAAHMAKEIPRWAELVKKSGATAN